LELEAWSITMDLLELHRRKKQFQLSLGQVCGGLAAANLHMHAEAIRQLLC
jgi:hypothetical protein